MVAACSTWQPMRSTFSAQRTEKGPARNEFVDELSGQNIAYVPFFPLGAFTPLQSSALDAAAVSLKMTPMQVALAWLLHRAPNILPIPGTSSVNPAPPSSASRRWLP
jgi:aryl-alcohol dehydrogenase-like predicted oxidoreductase